MILLQCVTAYVALNQMMEKEWDYNTAYALVRLRRWLQPHVDYFTAEEMRLARAYGRKNEDGTVIFDAAGRFKFEDESLAPEYAKKRAELGMAETGEEWEKISVPFPEKITPAQLEALEAFIEFKE